MSNATLAMLTLEAVRFGSGDDPAAVVVVTVQKTPDTISTCLPLALLSGETQTNPARGTASGHLLYPMSAALVDLENGQALQYADTPYLPSSTRPGTQLDVYGIAGHSANRVPLAARLLLHLGYTWEVVRTAFAATSMNAETFAHWRTVTDPDTWAAYDAICRVDRALKKADSRSIDSDLVAALVLDLPPDNCSELCREWLATAREDGPPR